MKVAIEPFMVRHRGLDGVCRFASEMGYRHIELSIRDDFVPLFYGPHAGGQKIAELKKSLHPTALVATSRANWPASLNSAPRAKIGSPARARRPGLRRK